MGKKALDREKQPDVTAGVLQEGVRAFLVLGETMSFQEAAARLGKSQPAVSRSVAALEADLCVELLDRSVRPVRLTPEGRALREFLKGEHARLSHLLTGLRSENAVRQPLRIGICESLSWSFSSALAQEAKSGFSSMTILVGASYSLLAQMDAGDLDMLFCSNPFVNRNDLAFHFVFEEPMVLVFPKGAPLASGEAPGWHDLQTCGLPYVRCAKMNATTAEEQKSMSEQGFVFPSRLVVNENALLLQFVARGLGWGVTKPATLAQHPELAREVRVFPVPGAQMMRRASVVTKAGADPRCAERVAGVLKAAYVRDVVPEELKIIPWIRGLVGTEDSARRSGSPRPARAERHS